MFQEKNTRTSLIGIVGPKKPTTSSVNDKKSLIKNNFDPSQKENRRPIKDQQSPLKPPSSHELANKYIRETFTIWQENSMSSHDDSDDLHTIGLSIWSFLRRFNVEWSQVQRDAYLCSLGRVREASVKLVDDAVKWAAFFKPQRRSFFLSLKHDSQEYLEHSTYMPLLLDCKTEIFEIIEKRLGDVSTKFASAQWPCITARKFQSNNIDWKKFAYIVDFNEQMFYLLLDNRHGSHEAGNNFGSSSCRLLLPIEKILRMDTLPVFKEFKFAELPSTADEFLIQIEN